MQFLMVENFQGGSKKQDIRGGVRNRISRGSGNFHGGHDSGKQLDGGYFQGGWGLQKCQG